MVIVAPKEREAEAKAADLAREHGMWKARLSNGKARFGGMDVSEARRLKPLDNENVRLKKLPAEQMLDPAAMRELLSQKAGSVAHPKAMLPARPSSKGSCPATCHCPVPMQRS